MPDLRRPRARRARARPAPAIDALFAEALGELGAPGLAYGVALDGELVHSGGCGVREPRVGHAARCRHGLPHLLDDEELHGDDRALAARRGPARHRRAARRRRSRAARSWREAGPDAPPVTVRQLLTMDAGLPQDDPWADRLMAEDSAWVQRDAVRARRDALARARARTSSTPTTAGRRSAASSRPSRAGATRTSCASACSSRSALAIDGLERRRPARRSGSRRATARPARASRRRCRWPTAATSRRSAASTAACATWRAGAACSSTPSRRATRPRARP